MAPHRPRPIRAQPATHPATQPPNSTPTQPQRQQPPKASSDRSKQPTSRHTQPHREHTQSLHHVSAIRHKARHQMCDDRDHGPCQITTRAARERESGRERERESRREREGADRRRRERERERDSRRERERGEEQDRENHAEGRPAAANPGPTSHSSSHSAPQQHPNTAAAPTATQGIKRPVQTTDQQAHATTQGAHSESASCQCHQAQGPPPNVR